jgi:mercuric ion binding protein
MVNGQSKNEKRSFEVKGNCSMCKTRIERAALSVKGVKYANWDIPTKQLSLILDEFKCSTLEVKKAIAAVGHDVDSIHAYANIYEKLSPCCKYRDPNSSMLNHNRSR